MMQYQTKITIELGMTDFSLSVQSHSLANKLGVARNQTKVFDRMASIKLMDSPEFNKYLCPTIALLLKYSPDAYTIKIYAA